MCNCSWNFVKRKIKVISDSELQKYRINNQWTWKQQRTREWRRRTVSEQWELFHLNEEWISYWSWTLWTVLNCCLCTKTRSAAKMINFASVYVVVVAVVAAVVPSFPICFRSLESFFFYKFPTNSYRKVDSFFKFISISRRVFYFATNFSPAVLF